jgi:hypothetical protein
VEFSKASVQVWHNNLIVLEGTQEPPGLWKIQLESTQQANAIFTTPFKWKAISFLHASMFSPATQTWIKPVDNGHQAPC